MSDAFWIALLTTAVPSTLTVIMTIVLALKADRTKDAVEKSGEDAIRKAEEVSAKLDVTGNHTDVKLHEIKTLVNGGVEKSLRAVAIAMRRLADTTGKEGDIQAADAADAALAEHIKAQIEVDVAHKNTAVAVAKEIASQPQSIGQMAKETMEDVKIVKEDVKELKEDK